MIPAKDEARACAILAREADATRVHLPTWCEIAAVRAMLSYASEREREAIERAAGIAEQYREEAGGSDSYKTACKHIATAIRRLSQEGGE